MVSPKEILSHHGKHENWTFLFVSVAEQLSGVCIVVCDINI
jgi:hypothetical protein